MGQKTHQIGFPLGIPKTWITQWYANRDFPALLREDELLRKYLKARLGHAAIADIRIERKPGKVVVTIHTGRPGVVIGKKGAEVDQLRDELSRLSGKEVGINVEEIKRPELDAQLVADNIENQLAQRISFPPATDRPVQPAPQPAPAASNTHSAAPLVLPPARRPPGTTRPPRAGRLKLLPAKSRPPGCQLPLVSPSARISSRRQPRRPALPRPMNSSRRAITSRPWRL